MDSLSFLSGWSYAQNYQRTVPWILDPKPSRPWLCCTLLVFPPWYVSIHHGSAWGCRGPCQDRPSWPRQWKATVASQWGKPSSKRAKATLPCCSFQQGDEAEHLGIIGVHIPPGVLGKEGFNNQSSLHLLFCSEGQEYLFGFKFALTAYLSDALFLHFGIILARNVDQMPPIEVGDVGLLVCMANKCIFSHIVCT